MVAHYMLHCITCNIAFRVTLDWLFVFHCGRLPLVVHSPKLSWVPNFGLFFWNFPLFLCLTFQKSFFPAKNSWFCDWILEYLNFVIIETFNLKYWTYVRTELLSHFWSAHRWSLNLVYHHHPPPTTGTQQVNKDDIFHAYSYCTNLKTITSELITKEILVLVINIFIRLSPF